jgi:hypothetical protein
MIEEKVHSIRNSIIFTYHNVPNPPPTPLQEGDRKPGIKETARGDFNELPS